MLRDGSKHRQCNGPAHTAAVHSQPTAAMNVRDLSILTYPHPSLRVRAERVGAPPADIRAVADRMIDLMRDAEGIGLAATQVGLPWRLFVLHVPPAEDRSADSDPPTATRTPIVFVNPTIVSMEEAPVPFEEGCLSLPDVRGDVMRPPIVTIRATDPEGREFTLRCAGLLARCVQHEFDHLDGVLIIDRMTQISRLKVRSAVRELERNSAERL